MNICVFVRACMCVCVCVYVCVCVRMCVRMLVWVRPFECKKNYGTCCCVVEEGGEG